MRRIIYSSIAAPDLDRAALIHLLYHARVSNERRGLSGILLRSNQRFLQVLEGETWKVCAAFAAIRRDVRHSHVEVMDERGIDEATFGRWPMRYFEDSNIAKALNTLSAEAHGAMPKVVDEAILNFFGCDHAKANQLMAHPV
jgi:hypothetical protein